MEGWRDGEPLPPRTGGTIARSQRHASTRALPEYGGGKSTGRVRQARMGREARLRYAA